MAQTPDPDRPHSNRRDFLTGRAAHREILQRGSEAADQLQAAVSALPPSARETVRLETRAMACQWAVVMNPGPPRQVMTASDALDLVHAAEEMLTVYRPDSEVSRLNQNASDGPVAVSSELFAFLQECRQLWTETEGAFDPAAGALIQLWRTARQNQTVPTEEEIAAAMEISGFQYVELNPDTETVAFTRPGVLVDFAAIGKGYAVDRAIQHLRQEGVVDALVHGGHSSLMAIGNHTGQTGWPVGIKNPLFTEERYVTMPVINQAMSTSGSNIQFFRHEGRRYGHLLDPRTGWPSETLLSVSVLAPTATVAEALSTAFYAMGLDKAKAYCHHHSEIGAIFVPPPQRGRTLTPTACNIPPDQLFFHPSGSPPEHSA